MNPRPTSLSGLLPFVRPYKGRVALAGLFLLLAAGATLAFPWALRQLIDQGLTGPDSAERLAGQFMQLFGVAAALALGASAVQVGTAYLLCSEATTSKVHREALKSEAARHTALTNLFTGRPARGIVNRVMRELGALSSVAPEFPLATSAITPLRKVGHPEDVAGAVTYLASDQAGFITGQTIQVDGGMTSGLV